MALRLWHSQWSWDLNLTCTGELEVRQPEPTALWDSQPDLSSTVSLKPVRFFSLSHYFSLILPFRCSCSKHSQQWGRIWKCSTNKWWFGHFWTNGVQSSAIQHQHKPGNLCFFIVLLLLTFLSYSPFMFNKAQVRKLYKLICQQPTALHSNPLLFHTWSCNS